MSSRTRFSILKGIRPENAMTAIDYGIAAGPGDPPAGSSWSDCTYTVQAKRYYAVACEDALVIADDAWRFAKTIALHFDVPHLELRIQESDHWDFTLERQGQIVADFSTRVAYFDPSRRRPWKAGDIQAFATGWGISKDAARPYLIDWDSIAVPRLAVAGDSYPAGTWEQVFDFMRLLGVASPFEHPNRFEFESTEWVQSYRRQPLWRRFIRNMSVRLRGVYPDIPRRTAEQQQSIERLRASVQIKKSTLDELTE